MINWRIDIENAPQDGTQILVWSESEGFDYVEYRFNDCGYTIPFETWCIVGSLGTDMLMNDFTHWFLPIPPSTKCTCIGNSDYCEFCYMQHRYGQEN